ncbi:MAG: putative flagellar L-ring protein 1 [Microvirga sp.]|jgi:flagellar L-ring protein precursor FlgH|nr:putative flagellar L-ring protein 1 [Microvirga sp.]
MLGYRQAVVLLALLSAGFGYAAPVIDPDTYRGLTSDRRAYDVGDQITVIILESTSAASSAGTSANAATSISAQAGKLDDQTGVAMSVAGDTAGNGQTSRAGQVRANITTRIIERTKTGLLLLDGDQNVTVNDEQQHIRIRGFVRPDDISADNTVMSYRLENIQLEIVGDGVVTSAQKQNFVYRFLKWLRIL